MRGGTATRCTRWSAGWGPRATAKAVGSMPRAPRGRPERSRRPGASPLYVPPEPRPWLPRSDHPRRAAVSAFGFGGSNFHCVLEEATPDLAAIDWDGDTQLIAFSAGTPDALLAAIDNWPHDL